SVRIWDELSGVEVHKLPHHGYANGVAFSPDRSVLVVTGRQGKVTVWKSTDWKKAKPEGLAPGKGHAGAEVLCVACRPDGKYFATGGRDNEVSGWSVGKDTPVFQVKHSGFVQGVAFSPDSKWGASVAHRKQLLLWDGETGAVKREWQLAVG